MLKLIQQGNSKEMPRKFRIGYSIVNFVGRVLSNSGISMQTNKVGKVVKMATPSDKVGV